MSMNKNTSVLATAANAPPSLLSQVGMAGTAAVLTVTFIHPIDVIKVCVLQELNLLLLLPLPPVVDGRVIRQKHTRMKDSIGILDMFPQTDNVCSHCEFQMTDENAS